MNKRIALSLIFLSILSLCAVKASTVKATPKTITVPDDYPTIQAAIGNATDGDTVFVRKGIYHGSTEGFGIHIDRPISLIGEDSQTTVIRGAWYRYTYEVIGITSGNVTISGFTITSDGGSASSIVVTNGDLANGSYSQVKPSGVRIIENNIVSTYGGIGTDGGENNVISQNNITLVKGIGVYLTSSNSVVSGNNIAGNLYSGIVVDSCENVTIKENNIMNNEEAGLTLGRSGPNNIHVYHNNFINNTFQVQDLGLSLYLYNLTSRLNTGDNGFPSGGNYWSDYLTRYPNATEIDSTKIANTPFVMSWYLITDNYPLVEPFNSTPPRISVISPLNQTYTDPNVPLVFTLDKQVSWTGFSLDGKQNVTLNSNSTIANLTQGSHSIVVYANGTFEIAGASEAVTFAVVLPSQSPNPTPTLQPTLEPSQSATPTTVPIVDGVNNLPCIIGAIIVIIVTITIVGLAVYFAKFRKKKETS